MRADYNEGSFSVKYVSSCSSPRGHSPSAHRCVGVFDTVGSLGLPEELSFGSKKIKTLFGFPDSVLGDHIEWAYQALALNEIRADFVRPCHVSRTCTVLTRRVPRIATNSSFQKRGEGRSKS